MSPFSPQTRAGWMPDQVRHDGKLNARFLRPRRNLPARSSFLETGIPAAGAAR